MFWHTRPLCSLRLPIMGRGFPVVNCWIYDHPQQEPTSPHSTSPKCPSSHHMFCGKCAMTRTTISTSCSFDCEKYLSACNGNVGWKLNPVSWSQPPSSKNLRAGGMTSLQLECYQTRLPASYKICIVYDNVARLAACHFPRMSISARRADQWQMSVLEVR